MAVAPTRFTDHGVELWDIYSKKLLGRFGGGTRSFKLILYPILVLLWPIAWTWLCRPEQPLPKRARRWIVIFLIALWLGGFLLSWYLVTAQLITISNNGSFGMISLKAKVAIVALSTIGIVTGMQMMVLGLRGLLNRWRLRISHHENLEMVAG